jgi:predicted exporter
MKNFSLQAVGVGWFHFHACVRTAFDLQIRPVLLPAKSGIRFQSWYNALARLFSATLLSSPVVFVGQIDLKRDTAMTRAMPESW